MCHCEVFFVSFATSNKQRQSFEFDAMQHRIYPCDVCDGARRKLVLADARLLPPLTGVRRTVSCESERPPTSYRPLPSDYIYIVSNIRA